MNTTGPLMLAYAFMGTLVDADEHEGSSCEQLALIPCEITLGLND